MTVFIGISSMHTKTEEIGYTLEEPSKLQFLDVEKARLGPQGAVRVLRLFERQKFGEMHYR